MALPAPPRGYYGGADHDAGMTPKAAGALQAFFTGGGHEQVVTVAH